MTVRGRAAFSRLTHRDMGNVIMMSGTSLTCDRGICTSMCSRFHVRAYRDVLQQYPYLTASSPSMALVHKLRNPRFLFTESLE
ncbi:hypothetical protein C9I43_14190 [Shewanella morhuae]|uniref:Uncharacterized protein n=1 Tax=Shewanella morhuae TaxID=365591 RepID=A0ABX5HXD0_9GAMM|nr:hypothetical protein C9I43_14190 [Shewanella morhuae]